MPQNLSLRQKYHASAADYFHKFIIKGLKFRLNLVKYRQITTHT